MAVTKISIPTPDDWHVHLRDGEMLKETARWTGRDFARAIVMPNLKPPILTAQEAVNYREHIVKALGAVNLKPLMTIYLTDQTTPQSLKESFESGAVVAAKYYPANATTHSEAGVTSLSSLMRLCESLAELDAPLLVHGEVTRPDVDIFDKEKVFIDEVLAPILKQFPKLRVVFEHITTNDAVEFVKAHDEQMGATITAHHLEFNRNAMFKGGIRPHYYCLPVAKREIHRQGLIAAATSGHKSFFLGTDSAPHSIKAKESACGCAGLFTAPTALATYAEIFYKAKALEKLAGFASLNGPKFYRLPVNTEITELERLSAPLTFDNLVPLSHDENVQVFTPEAGVMWKATRRRPTI